MKLIVFVVFLFSSLICVASQGNVFEIENSARSILNKVKIDKNYLDLKKVLQFKSVAHASEWDYSVKRFSNEWDFWKNLNFQLYRNEFKELIQVEFKDYELNEIDRTYGRDYNVKKLNSIIRYTEFFKLYNDLILGRNYYVTFPEERKKLVEDLYDYLGIKILEVNLKERLNHFQNIHVDTFKVVDFDTKEFAYIRPKDFQQYKNNVKDLLFIMLAKSLQEFSDHELKSFIIQKNKNLARRFTQLYVNYHYLFLLDNILSNEVSLGLITPEES